MRWALATLARNPLAWLLVLVLASVWPGIATLSPLGLATSKATPAGVLYEVAFLALLLAHLVSLSWMHRLEWHTHTLPVMRRIGLALSTSSCAAVVLLCAGIGPAFGLGALEGVENSEMLKVFASFILTHLHLAALQFLLSAAPLAPQARLLSLICLAWILPAVLAAAPLFHGVLPALRVRQYLTWAKGSAELELSSCPTILALWLAGFLLCSRTRGPQRP